MKALVNVMVIGITPVNENAMPFAECLWYSNSACSVYEKRIEEACLELNVPFLAIHEEMVSDPSSLERFEPDGIHLNSKGNKWIYNKLTQWKTLNEWADLD